MSGMASALKLAPLASAKPAAVTLVEARVAHGVTTLLNSISNWAGELPPGNVTTYLAGVIQILRRNLFNQAPNVTPVQQATTSFSAAGTFKGNLGIIDIERDPWTATVVAAPRDGTVELDAETGRYVYTSGPTFSGSDSFTVRVAPVARAFNLLAPFSDGAKTVTIQVGSGALTNPWQSSVLTSGVAAVATHQDPTDVSLYLPDGPVSVRIQKDAASGQYLATVTTKTITDKTKISWMTPTGSPGETAVREFLDLHWDEFKLKAGQNGATGTMMTIDFRDNDEAHRKSPGVLVEIPHLRGFVSVVVGGCRWWCVGGFPRRRGGLGGGRTRRRG